MAGIFRKRQPTSSRTSTMSDESLTTKKESKYTKDSGYKTDSTKEIKNLTKEFLIEMKTLSQAQKINMIYSNLTGKKPDPGLTPTKKINRILYEQKFGAKIKHTQKFMKGKKKYRFPFKWRKVMKLANKKGKQILVWYFNRKGVIEPPKLHPLYASDMIIVRNKPHEVDPRAFWRLGKNQCLCIKEIDRRPISNLDYAEIKARGDSTDSDEFIIKAAMQAVIGGVKKKVAVNKVTLIILGLIAAGAIIFFMSR